MRNVATADPHRVSVEPESKGRVAHRSERWRDAIATAAMILIGAALLLPFGGAQAGGGSVLISPEAIRALPMSGTAWTSLLKYASALDGVPDIADQDSTNDVHTLAQALVFVRTGTSSFRTHALANLHAAVGTETGGRTLALGRNLPSYVIAADLINLDVVDPTFNSNVFRPWLRSLLSKTMADGTTLRQIDELRPNNWGTHAGAARAAIAVYLGDATELARTARVFQGWLGDRSAYAGFKYGSDTSWQADPSHAVAIDAVGATKAYDGTRIALDGALPDEMRRGDSFRWAPTYTGYPWEALQGAVLQAEILHHNGFDSWNWSSKALYRAARWLYTTANWPAVGDDRWQPWLIDARTGARLPRPSTTTPGKNFGFADWLYAD
jgi:hypothetical protein